MSTGWNDPGRCPHCGMFHTETCPRIKAIECHPDGTTKRVEFHAPQPVMIPMPPPVDLSKAFEQ